MCSSKTIKIQKACHAFHLDMMPWINSKMKNSKTIKLKLKKTVSCKKDAYCKVSSQKRRCLSTTCVYIFEYALPGLLRIFKSFIRT